MQQRCLTCAVSCHTLELGSSETVMIFMYFIYNELVISELSSLLFIKCFYVFIINHFNFCFVRLSVSY
jgi:hypothetical protein